VTKAKKRRGKKAPPPPPPRAKVHAKIVTGATDLATTVAMVKPAILYADEVTLHSPVASMVQGVRELETVTDPREQMLAALSICQAVPHFANQLNLDATTLEQLICSCS
jgi:hypothetical protein